MARQHPGKQSRQVEGGQEGRGEGDGRRPRGAVGTRPRLPRTARPPHRERNRPGQVAAGTGCLGQGGAAEAADRGGQELSRGGLLLRSHPGRGEARQGHGPLPQPALCPRGQRGPEEAWIRDRCLPVVVAQSAGQIGDDHSADSILRGDIIAAAAAAAAEEEEEEEE